MKTHYLLALLLHPLLAPAQAGPPVNLQVGPVLQLPAGAVPVDALPFYLSQPVPAFSVLVPAQGTNMLYQFRPSIVPPAVLGLYSSYALLGVPLNMVPLPGQARTSEMFVLTANGSVQKWRDGGFGPGNSTVTALRQGLACAPTDRLLVDRFPNNTSFAVAMACWSDGPQPGLARAEPNPQAPYLYRPLAPATYAGLMQNTPTGPVLAVQPGGRTAAAYLMTQNPAAGPTLFLTQPADTSGRVAYWPGTTTGWWTQARWWTPPRGAGPCRGIAGEQLNGSGGAELVVLRRDITVYFTDGASAFRLSSAAPETYALLPVPLEVRLADLNGDQLPEMIVLGDDGTLNVFENTSAVPGSTALFASLPYVLPTGLAPATLRVADYDDDGDLDVLVPCRGDGTVCLFRNDRLRLGTAPATTALALAVYPTPATSTLTLRWAAPGGGTAPAAVALLDALGRTVRAWPAVAPGTTLDVAGLARGVYALRVQGAAGRATRRVVLE